MAWLPAQHGDLAAVRLAQALDDLQRGGLAGAVRAQDPEELAALHLEGHAVHGGHLAVRLAQVTHRDRGRHARHRNRTYSVGPGRQADRLLLRLTQQPGDLAVDHCLGGLGEGPTGASVAAKGQPWPYREERTSAIFAAAAEGSSASCSTSP